MTTQAHYGERIRQARIKLGIYSQREFARRTGLDKKTIARHEAAKTPPDPTDRVVQAIAGVLGLDEGDLLLAGSSAANGNRGDSPDPGAALVRYFSQQADKGNPVSTATMTRLLALPWARLDAPNPTTEQIHVMRQALDAFGGV